MGFSFSEGELHLSPPQIDLFLRIAALNRDPTAIKVFTTTKRDDELIRKGLVELVDQSYQITDKGQEIRKAMALEMTSFLALLNQPRAVQDQDPHDQES